MNIKKIYIYSVLLFLVYPSGYQINAQTEKFVDVEKYLATNNTQSSKIISKPDDISEKKAQEIVEFIESRVEREDQERLQKNQRAIDKEKQLAEALVEQTIVDEDGFELADQSNIFQKIDAIVLDAGHGGKHIGAERFGVEEKEIVLILVKKIHKLFRTHNKKIKIYVTRKNDSYVSLEDRVSKTARWSTRKNILFISVHVNAALNTYSTGFEIYTLSDKASDPEALITERIENAGFTKEDIEKTKNTYSILADLIRDGTRIQSEWLAKYVYDATLQSAQVYGRGLRRANFFVLKYNTVPSILVEVGFLSNPEERKKLQTEQYQNKLAIGLYQGISRYIKEYNETEGFTK